MSGTAFHGCPARLLLLRSIGLDGGLADGIMASSGQYIRPGFTDKRHRESRAAAERRTGWGARSLCAAPWYAAFVAGGRRCGRNHPSRPPGRDIADRSGPVRSRWSEHFRCHADAVDDTRRGTAGPVASFGRHRSGRGDDGCRGPRSRKPAAWWNGISLVYLDISGFHGEVRAGALLGVSG